jgi:tripartite-type tricarboxylate transporter receptor subunit TctC
VNPFRIMAATAGILAAALLLATLADRADAQTAYPAKTIKIVIGFPAGTAPDTLARLLGDKLQPALGQPVVVENVVGAGGNIAAERVARSEADGHTLLLTGNAAIVVNQHLYERLPYDPVRDLAPISQIAMTPNVLVVPLESPAKTVQQLVGLAREQPDKLAYAHAGIGISQHLAGEMFKQMAGIAVRPIAYRGASTIYPDLLAGRVDLCFCNIATALPLARDGKLRALAVTSLKRSPSAPELPTMDESGFPGFDATAWFGLVAPARTPPAVLDRLHRETVKALTAADLRKTFDELGFVAIGNTPSEFAATISAESPYWSKVIKAIGLKMQ